MIWVSAWMASSCGNIVFSVFTDQNKRKKQEKEPENKKPTTNQYTKFNKRQTSSEWKKRQRMSERVHVVKSKKWQNECVERKGWKSIVSRVRANKNARLKRLNSFSYVRWKWNTIQIVCNVRVFMQPRRKLPPWTDCLSRSEQRPYDIRPQVKDIAICCVAVALSLSRSHLVRPSYALSCFISVSLWLYNTYVFSFVWRWLCVLYTTEEMKKKRRSRKKRTLYSQVNHNREEPVCWSHWKQIVCACYFSLGLECFVVGVCGMRAFTNHFLHIAYPTPRQRVEERLE